MDECLLKSGKHKIVKVRLDGTKNVGYSTCSNTCWNEQINESSICKE